MPGMLSKLYNASPKKVLRALWHKSQAAAGPPAESDRRREAREELHRRFAVYKTDHLSSISPEDFSSRVTAALDSVDAAAEGYAEHELEQQRDLSVKFHWGHNHDFGSFKVDGRMQDRHINMMADFVDLFPVVLKDFDGKDVFDIGCWTGGTTLMLASLGARVVSLEEVKKYAEMASFLVRSFGLEDRVTVSSQSLYECRTAEYLDRFDIVFFPGVIYHLSDPLIALRVLFNSLRKDGVVLIESAGIDHDEPFCRFDGSLVYQSGTRERMDRGGWNWFMPSASALFRMMREAGFDQIQTLFHGPTGRVYGYGRKTDQASICRAGLSVPDIR
jgi:SAM-dependent methyltransferase